MDARGSAMARSLIIILVAILTMGNSCQTTGKRLDAAATSTGQARAIVSRPVTPEACIAHMERVIPTVGEKARWTQKRWEFVADNRDRLADDCRADLDGYWDNVKNMAGAQ